MKPSGRNIPRRGKTLALEEVKPDGADESPASKAKKKKKNKKPTKKEIKKAAEEDGMDFFFGNRDNFIPAGQEEYEGHYPGNQNNAILIPVKKELVHASKS